MSRGRWRLGVSYPTGKGAYYWGSLDPDIVHAVGKLDTARGTSTDSTRRDLFFLFTTEGAARNARQRVLNLHNKGVRTDVSRA